jgi:hypothetical protein
MQGVEDSESRKILSDGFKERQLGFYGSKRSTGPWRYADHVPART